MITSAARSSSAGASSLRTAIRAVLIPRVALHFQAVQPGQQDRSGQAGGEEGDRATRDDSNDGVASG